MSSNNGPVRVMRVDIHAAANAGILAYLKGRRNQARRGVEADVPQRLPISPLAIRMDLGTHPDLLERLWVDLTAGLPVDCRWIVYGAPVLVNPAAGVVFAFAGGTHTYALRLPELARNEALTAGAPRIHKYPAYPELEIEASMLDLDDIGPEWMFGCWHKNEGRWCKAAFDFAGGRTMDPS